MHVSKLAIILIAVVSTARQSSAEIVFDNITGATQPGGGISTAAGYQGGNIVGLSGTSRDVTRLDVLLYEFSAGLPGDLTFRVNLWEPANVPNTPGNLLWSSPVQHASLVNRTPTTFSIDVPGIQVPDTLGWTVEAISNLHFAGLAGSFPATTGAIVGQMTYNTFVWSVVRISPSLDGVGFRLFAVPEPMTILLALIPIADLYTHRRRPTSPNRV
jgi:hypothetical protein